MADYEKPEVYLKRIADDIKTMRQQMTDVVFASREAESEIPEKMRRFVMYMHDMHDVKNLYDEHGQTVPVHVIQEVERCDDRLRQMLEQLHTDGGAFEKVRREMSGDPNNRWNHDRLLAKPQEPA